MTDDQEVKEEIFILGLDAHGVTVLDSIAEDPEEPPLTADERAAVLTQIQFLKGCILWASSTLIDKLFHDLLLNLPEEVPESQALSTLPPRLASQYDLLFTKNFLVQTIDLLSGTTQEWVPPKSVAQELAFKLLLEEVQFTADLYGIELPEHWIPACIEMMGWGDDDVDLLYDLSMDGVWNDDRIPLNAVNMDFPAWFKPFRPDRPLPPY